MANKIFENIGIKDTPYSGFDLSHTNTLTFNFGELVPSLLHQLVPGDKGKVSVEHLLRMQTMLAPVMGRSNISHHFFQASPRLVDRQFLNRRVRWNPASNTTWDSYAIHTTYADVAALTLDDIEFQAAPNRYVRVVRDYFGDSMSLDEAIAYEGTDSALCASGTLLDFMGVPCGPYFVFTKVSDILGMQYYNLHDNSYYTTAFPYSSKNLNLYPFLLYQLIYTTFYRPQDFELDWLHEILELIQSVTSSDSYVNANNIGTENFAQLFKLRHRCYPKDYFTTALPNAVKSTEFPNGVTVDTTGNSFTIEMLRLANATQKWLERDARAGSRYPEWTLSHFGVDSSNKLLDLPEFIGGFSSPLSVSEQDNTAALYDGQIEAPNTMYPLGAGTGKSLNYDTSGKLDYYSEEDSYLFCITSVIPHVGYSGAFRPELLRVDMLDDYYIPEFANLGEEAVKAGELCYLNAVPFMDDTTGELSWQGFDPTTDPRDYNEDTIGYQSRYADWKYMLDEVHGEFANSLDYFNFTRRWCDVKFNGDGTVGLNIPRIDSDWLHVDPADFDKYFMYSANVSSQFKMMMYFDLYEYSKKPEFPIPSL